jgi:tetratricopeptide (TPR) repeat protein
LSFLLALSGSNASSEVDPLKLILEATQIMGPNSDILDTRAVVETSQKQYKKAIQDLELSVTDNPTASKYFHKAVAHYKANEMRSAVEAWEQAEKLGLNRDALNRLEFDEFEEMKTNIDKLRKRSVTQAEPTRKAG